MIILASKSERRIELLKDANVSFKVIGSNIEESIDDELSPLENVLNIAKEKALDVFSSNLDSVVIAADTIVLYKNKVYGKPIDSEDAFNTLSELSNKTHEVITAVCIKSKKREELFYSSTKVTFKDLSEFDILDYINTKEPFGKAGSYAIQGIGKRLVLTYEGDIFNVIGLPLKEVLNKLKLFNINVK